jgi:hypothetical protein
METLRWKREIAYDDCCTSVSHGGEGDTSGGWSTNRTGKSCESVDFSETATLPAGAIVGNELRELVRVGGFDVVLGYAKFHPRRGSTEHSR